MKFIQAPELAPPAGHYSQATVSHGFVFLSGLLPAADAKGEVSGSFREQCESVFEKAAHVLRAADCDWHDVVSCTVYIVGIERWAELNDVYAAVFGEHKPARTVVPVPPLRSGALLEVQIVAARA
jgi:2-iminobutanoate/2-iminopropanoate deaminase